MDTSFLEIRHRRLRAMLVVFVALLLNTAYVVALPSGTLFYYANVVLHPVLGIGLVLALVRLVAVSVWKADRLLAGLVAGVVVSVLTGAALLVYGAATASRVLLQTHIVTTGVTTLLCSVYLWRHGGQLLARRGVRTACVLTVVLFALSPVIGALHESAWRESHAVNNPAIVPTDMTEEGAGPGSPFFPSSANTNTGDVIPADFFLTSEMCGRCHRDIYDQWNSSVHHFSSFNNQWYRKSIEYMQDVAGTEASKWCAGCHDHAVFFNGRFDTPIREQIDTPEAQAGLGCTSCHSVVHVGSTMGQGDFVIEYPPLHDLAASENPILAWTHDQLAYLAPEPHRRTFLKPFHRERSEEFCSSCHKVHLDVPVNGYRWIRGFNEYDNWQASGVSGQGARSFYYPSQAQTCNDCHMPRVPSDDPAAKDGYVKSHRFPGANTAIPFVNGDKVQLETVQEFLQAGQVSVDVFGIARTDEPTSITPTLAGGSEPTLASTFAVGEESSQFGTGPTVALTGPVAEVFAPLDDGLVSVRRGESVRVEVVVRTRNVGHFFPGGTVDAFDVWVELEAVDENGKVLLHSGVAADGGSGPVDPGAHFYRSLQLDERGNPINKRNAWMTRSVAYVRLIPPGAADTIHYRLQIPEDVGDRITLRAKVNYRKFAWWYTQWSYAGVRDPSQTAPSVTPAHDDGEWVFTGDTSAVSGPMKEIPDLPTTVMAENEAFLLVVDRDAPLPGSSQPETESGVLRGRWNDYGIGLLLQGDTRAAAAAFRRVMALDPLYPDGPVNVARALLREGDVEAAVPLLERALELEPALARAHYFLGTALRTLGRYEEALRHFEVARVQYPRDRVVLGQIGRVHFLERRFEDAVATFKEVLSVDPEDLQAHYNLMLAYRGMGDLELAALEENLYDRFKADESAQAITGPYRLIAPEDNNERQPVHEHR